MANKQKDKQSEKKIIVDEDWKQQARREKEILAAKEQAEREKAEAQKRHEPLPPGDFTALVTAIATQALIALGALVPKGQEKPEPDLEVAKYNIDMLVMLEAKTKGNLTKQEEKLLSAALHQARMIYVKAAE